MACRNLARKENNFPLCYVLLGDNEFVVQKIIETNTVLRTSDCKKINTGSAPFPAFQVKSVPEIASPRIISYRNGTYR